MSGKRDSGIFHSLKQQLFHGESHVDSDYEAVHTRFSHYNGNLLKLRSNASNYIAGIYSTFLNSNNVAVDFSQMLEETAQPNDYQEIARESRAAHNRLNSDKQQAIAGQLTEKVIHPIDEELKVHQSLLTRIGRRNELHSELEYYLNKIHSLNKDRETRASKGKAESSSDMEKFNRNNDKLTQARNDYTAFASTLMADLTNNWNARVAILGPALASFIQAEKAFLQLYATELNEINKTEKLPTLSQSAPLSAMPPPITSADVPLPVVAGDLQIKPSEGQPTVYNYNSQPSAAVVDPSGPVEAWSERQAVVGAQYGSEQQAASAAPISEPINTMPVTQAYNPANPFDDQPPETTIPGGAANAPAASADILNLQSEPRPIVVDPSSQLSANASLAGTSGFASTKTEEESKRQRFEQDAKQQEAQFA